MHCRFFAGSGIDVRRSQIGEHGRRERGKPRNCVSTTVILLSETIGPGLLFVDLTAATL